MGEDDIQLEDQEDEDAKKDVEDENHRAVHDIMSRSMRS